MHVTASDQVGKHDDDWITNDSDTKIPLVTKPAARFLQGLGLGLGSRVFARVSGRAAHAIWCSRERAFACVRYGQMTKNHFFFFVCVFLSM